MCWDEQTSWTTLFIGTVVNLYILWDLFQRKDNGLEIAIMTYWQFALLMQLPEALIWRSEGTDKSAIQLAFWLNVLQPVYVYVVTFAFMSPQNRLLTSVFIAVYLGYILFNLKSLSMNVLKKGCPHLSFSWWEDAIATILYFVTTVVVLLALPSPLLRYTTLALFGGSYLLTTWLYPCSYGSMWCWSIAFAGILTYVMICNT